MRSRRIRMGLSTGLGAACLFLIGCGVSGTDNITEPERPATKEDVAKAEEALRNQTKAMPKPPL